MNFINTICYFIFYYFSRCYRLWFKFFKFFCSCCTTAATSIGLNSCFFCCRLFCNFTTIPCMFRFRNYCSLFQKFTAFLTVNISRITFGCAGCFLDKLGNLIYMASFRNFLYSCRFANSTSKGFDSFSGAGCILCYFSCIPCMFRLRYITSSTGVCLDSFSTTSSCCCNLSCIPGMVFLCY